MRAMRKHMILKRVHHLSSDWLSAITDGSRLHWGIIVAILVAFLMWFLLDRTTSRIMN